MQFIMSVFDLVVHLDAHLRSFASDYGVWVYVLLFVVIFCETGLVVTPFLPGDSMIFMLGTLSAVGIFRLAPTVLLLSIAAILGDTVNYHIGKFIGPKAFSKENGRFFKHDNLVAAQEFYAKWGGSAIVLGRFMPIIRTFVPFAAGIGSMSYPHFLSFNAIGGVCWVLLFSLCGYFFGNVPFVKENLTIIIYGIVLVSVLPAVIGWLKSRRVPA
jgi:membrane-associated protein